MTRLGELIKKRRESEGLSLREFSERCSLSHSYIKNLEDGDPRTGKSIVPTIDSLEKIAPALGMSLEELLKSTGYIPDNNRALEMASLKFIRGKRTFDEVCKDIQIKTGIPVSPSTYKAIEEGKEGNPPDIFINTLVQYMERESSFIDNGAGRKSLDGLSNDLLQHIDDENLKKFIYDPGSSEYLRLAKDLFDRKIKVKFIRSTFFED